MGAGSKIAQGALGEVIDFMSELNKRKTTDNLPPQLGSVNLITDGKIPEGAVPASSDEMRKFFGMNQKMMDMEDLGVLFTEKPTYFSDIAESLSSIDLYQVNKTLGSQLETYKINEVLSDPNQPLSDKLIETDEPIIVWDPEKNKRYLADPSGARDYIRHWSEIKDE